MLLFIEWFATGLVVAVVWNFSRGHTLAGNILQVITAIVWAFFAGVISAWGLLTLQVVLAGIAAHAIARSYETTEGES